MPTGEALHKVLESIKTALFAMGVVFFTSFVAWASGITVPDNSRLNVNSGELHVETDPSRPGSIINRGVVRTTTGKIRLNGNWTTVGIGSYEHGTGTVIFTAPLGHEQFITPGTVAGDAFYHLTHQGAGDLKLSTNTIKVLGDMSNLDGTLYGQGIDMEIYGGWINTSATTPSFVAGGNLVSLVGNDQEIQGETTFYDLNKHLADATGRQLTLPSGKEQTITHMLTLRGYANVPGQYLVLRTSAGVDPARLNLTFTGIQNIRYVDVQDNTASGRTLVARESPDHSDYATYKNINWFFATVTVKWDGAQDDRWDNPFNWNLGLVPEETDIVIIPYDDEAPTPTPLPHQPVLQANGVKVASLEIKANATLTMDRYSMEVTGDVINAGTIVLNGNETFTAATMSSNTGTFRYVGSTSGALNVTIPGSFVVGGTALSTYHGLIIDEQAPGGSPDTFTISENLMVGATAEFKSGNCVLGAAKRLEVKGLTTVDGGTLNAQNGDLELGSLLISGGTLTAPSAASTFTVSGNLTRSGGAFVPNGGTVELVYDAANPMINQTILGQFAFYGLKKEVVLPQIETLTFGAGGAGTDLVMVSHHLVLKGLAAPNYLYIASTSPNVASGHLRLATGAVQDIQRVFVEDNDATGGLTLIARNSPDHSDASYAAVNWAFGAYQFRWDGNPLASSGALPTEWNEPSNWDLGTVPIAGDTVIIRSEDEDNGNAPITSQPILSTDVSVGNLTIGELAPTQGLNASLTLDGHNLTVETVAPAMPGVFSNHLNGIVYLDGDETLDLTQDIDSGAFVYYGNGNNNGGSGYGFSYPDSFYDLRFEAPPSGAASSFSSGVDVTVYGSLGISGANFHIPSYSLDVRGDFTMTGGGFTAPGVSEDFFVTGDFTHTAGVFFANGGTLTLNATSTTVTTEQSVFGTTVFSGLRKRIPAGIYPPGVDHILKFDNTGLQTITRDLDIGGILGYPLKIRSTSTSPTASVREADISLQPGGLQHINYVDVQDSNASSSGGLWLVARDSDDHSDFAQYNNTHWLFNIATVTWTGRVSTDWNDAQNWDLGLVPLNGGVGVEGDDAVIPNVTNDPHLTNPPGAINLRNMTVETDGNVYLDGFGMTLTGALSNNGNIILQGTEHVAVATIDTDHGTFTYTGPHTGTPALEIFDLGGTAYAPLTYNNLVIAAGASDTFVLGSALNVKGGLTLSGGTLDAGDVPVVLSGALLLNGGTLIAPDTSSDATHTFTALGNWTNTSGTFNANSGEVIFGGTNNITISGDTTFWDFTMTGPAAGRTVTFQQGSNQTIGNALDMVGATANKLVLRSSTDSTEGNPTDWLFTILSGTPIVNNLDVRDAKAVFPASNPTPRPFIIALNSIDQKNGAVSTNTNWRFLELDLIAPLDGRVVGPTPVIIGHGMPGELVTIIDKAGDAVATAMVDADGNFRVLVGRDDGNTGGPIKAALDISTGTNDNELVPVYAGYPGNKSTITVVASPDTTQTPVITDPPNYERLGTERPTIRGRGKPGAHVIVVASDENGVLPLTLPPNAYGGEGTVDANGDFAVPMVVSLPRGNSYISVIIDGVSSQMMQYLINDVKGVVFDSVSNRLVKDARVTIYNGDGTICQPGVNISPFDTNPFITGVNGQFFFLTRNANYMIKVEALGYEHPTKLSDAELPAGRDIGVGSRGEVFTPSGTVLKLDQPVDANGLAFRVEKKVNKPQARIGEVVTYTVTIESLMTANTVVNTRLVDMIPPGFKYMPGRAQFEGVPVEPAGNRPIVFDTGDFAPLQKKTLRYQLVIGSGVAPGNYENAAYMKYVNDFILSNKATATVEIVLDPLFDAGVIFGKVFYDWNENGRQDGPEYVAEDREQVVESPVPNVRLVMEDGTVVTADLSGQFHIPALMPGRHLVRLDERSLPAGAYLTTDKVQVVDITPGSIFKVNFGVNMDNARVVGEDAQFFQKDFAIDQATTVPAPRLNVNVFNDNILIHNDTVIEQIEFRIFTNYAPFLMSWQLDVIDADTKKLVRSFTGTRGNIFDPVYWDGRDIDGNYLKADRKYAYALKVQDENGKWDETSEQGLAIKVMADSEMTERQRQRSDQEKTEESLARAKKYRAYLLALSSGSALKTRNIWVKGDTVVLKSVGADVRQVRVLKGGELFTEVPVLERQGLTARELMGGVTQEQSVPMEIILPDGEYEIEVVSAEGVDQEGATTVLAAAKPAEGAGSAAAAASGPIQMTMVDPVSVQTARHKRVLKVGEDYLMFVAMGDGKVGYNMNRGNIEPVQNNEKYRRGFYKEGKMAYYLKGKIKGKYLVTSSFDPDRQAKAALRTFKNEEYYPVYGDASTLNYDATNTEGPLYLSVDWDKSQAIWGNYAVAFNDLEFANYTRTLYGGKIDYKTVASTDYGEPKTNVMVFHAEVRQRSAHNEFLATGGSLYYLKHQDIVQATDTIKLEVRDQVTGLVKNTVEMKEGVDYDMDYANGRVLFWRPVSMAVASDRLISNSLVSGDPIYVVADYEYFVQDQLAEGTRGARVTQAVGKNVVVGANYVSETQANRNYQLKGQDVTVHLGKDATVRAEYAQTSANAQNNYISTDGGITFSELVSAENATGKAYGIKQDARLFDRIGLKSYYKWIGDGFSTGGTASQQGKELKGMSMTFDMTPVTRLTVSQDIQRLIERGNLQTAMQVGAQETTTTLVQLVHDARRLRLKEEFQSVEVKGAEGVTTTKANTLSAAAQAEYALNEKTDLLLRHEAVLSGGADQVTTVGVRRQLTDKLSAALEQAFGTAGTATKAGMTANVTPKLALSTDYTLARLRTGENAQTVALGGKGQINKNTSLEVASSVTQNSSGAQESTMMVGGSTRVGEDTQLRAGVETTGSSDTAKSRQALSLEGTKAGKEGRETTTGVRLEDRLVGGKTTVITAGEKGQINPAMQLASERSFSYGAAGQDQADTYKIAKTTNGRTLETSYARKKAETLTERSESNIFGLSGDINDRVALQASLEKGAALNLDGSIYDRIVIAGALGYLEKDPETGKVVFQSSTKAEARFDKGVTDKQQYVLYQSAEGKLNDQTTLKGKFNYSITRNMETGKAEAGYKEIMLGAAYRPVAMDRVNLFGEYTYKENKGPVGQVAASDIEQAQMHVLSVGAAYELNERWELIEKLAMRVMEEKVTGFEFVKTHTWLLVNRANYVLNRDWKIGAEYRILTVKEAQDQKRGMLVEAVHSVNDNVELGIGYNFTNFMDDLTNLSYTVQGPFIRMTGKLYDQSPEERARAKAKWMERRVEIYAARMIKKELERPDSRVVADLNRMYQAARKAEKSRKYEQSRQLYKEILTVTQMMYEEVAQFIRKHIAYEEKVFDAFQRAREYYDKGDFWQARKLWEKIVEEASKAVLE